MSPRVFWPSLVVALLLLSVGTQVVAIVLATSDESFAVEPDYEQKAANWDQHQQQLALNARLGWSLELSIAPAATQRERTVRLVLLDSFARPLDGVVVDVEAFHNARASEIHSARLEPTRMGEYGAVLPIERPGLWEFRIDARRDQDRFTARLRKSVALIRPTGKKVR